MAVTLRLLAVAAACAFVFAAEAPGVVAVQPVDANKGAALVPADAGSKTPKVGGPGSHSRRAGVTKHVDLCRRQVTAGRLWPLRRDLDLPSLTPSR